MDVTEITHNIELVKSDNAQWLAYAEALIMGRPVSKGAVPAYRDQCIPCQWLYAHSSDLSHFYREIEKHEVYLFEFDIMDHIEILRYELHETYLKIFKLYLPVLNDSFFFHLFHLKKTVTDYEKIDAKRHFSEMQRVVEELNLMLDHLEQSLHRMCELNTA